LNKINKLGIGTVQFGLDYGISNQVGKTTKLMVEQILSYCEQIGINTLDTANAYGDSEKVLGQVGCNNFNVITKFIANSETECNRVFLESLSNLNTNYLYGLLSHNVPQLIQKPEIWNAMLKLKQENKVLKIGFSFDKHAEIDAIKRTTIIPDIIQIPYNIIDNRFIEIANYYKQKGTEIHSRSTFLQGLFFCNSDSFGAYFNPLKTLIKELQDSSNNLAADLLNYCLNNEIIDKVIIGVNNQNQLKEIINNLENANGINIKLPIINESLLAPSNWLK
jgi:aryl-alcohol dehydrogenase-like predicted oxidoreductase